MTIHASGNGERRIFVSYIGEVPVWKSTYRIVIPAAPATPFLQAWAIIDNTVGEDWKNVRLTLVSGAPQSFIQNISQPYYTRRPVVPVPQAVMLTPQAHEATLEVYAKLQPSGRTVTGAGGGEGAGVAGGLAGGVAGGSMEGIIGGVARKFGSTSETAEVNASTATIETSAAEIRESKRLRPEAMLSAICSNTA